MKVIDSAEINSGTVISNIIDIPPPAWASGTTYAAGTMVSLLSGPNNTKGDIYQSLVAANTGNDPASSPAQWKYLGVAYSAWSSSTNYSLDAVVTYGNQIYRAVQTGSNRIPPSNPQHWIDLGPSNKWAAFDKKTGTQSHWADEIRYTITPGDRVQAIAILNIMANEVQVIVRSGGVVEYDNTISMTSGVGIYDWFTYFFSRIERDTDIYLDMLPNIAEPEIEIIIRGVGTVSVGHVEVGRVVEIGRTHFGMQLGITDYSKKEEDEFGNWYFVERTYAKRMTLVATIANEEVNTLFNFLASIRATPVVVVGTESYTSSVQYGIFRDWHIELPGPCHSLLSVEFQGI